MPVIAAGGISDGRHLAMSLALGADAVWVGTRFVASTEGGAPQGHKERFESLSMIFMYIEVMEVFC